MNIRTRIIIATCALMALSMYWLVDQLTEDVRKYYLQAMEESLVDTSTLLASILSRKTSGGTIPVDDLRSYFEHASSRRFEARIYELVKTRMDMDVYVTDARGIVLFDSAGKAAGKDYSRWNDVYRTLCGDYGARSTRLDPEDPTTSVLHIASPVFWNGKIIGALTVYKSVNSATLFIEDARRTIVLAAVAACVIGLGLAVVVSFWITWPIRKLIAYAKAVRDGERAVLPRLGRTDLGTLSRAFEEMRDALEGREYVEHYVQALTHEMKSPVAAIRGAAEILENDLPEDKRRKFLGNIRSETERIQELVDRLLGLAAVEKRKQLEDAGDVDMAQLAADVVDGLLPVASVAGVTITCSATGDTLVRGEAILLRQAVESLGQNAIDFCMANGGVNVTVASSDGWVTVTVQDDGAGIPDYALPQVFNRFFSLQRPRSGRKSTGIGLTLTREVAELHGGSVSIGNQATGGAVATLSLPSVQPRK